MLSNSKPARKDFSLLVLGQVVSVLGSSLLRFALSLYALDLTGRADIYATLFAVSSIPLLLSPLGGAIADRFNRRNLMVIYDLASSAVVGGLMVLLWAGQSSVILIGVVMVLLGLISALYSPVVMASIPLLVQENKLEQANGIVSGVQALSGVAAPVLGGILYGAVGVEALIGMSCIVFFLSAIMELFIRIPFVRRASDGHLVPMLVQDLRAGFTYVVSQSYIRKSMILAALLNLLLTPLFVVGGPIILRVTMQSSDTTYGLGMGLIEFAAIVGALLAGLFAGRMRMHTLYRWLLLMAFLILPLAISTTPMMLRMGHYPSLVLFLLCASLIALMMTILSIFVISIVQKQTPNEQLGKVMAMIMAVSQCAAPAGQLIYGVLFEAFSVSVYIPVLLVGAAMLLMSVITQRMLHGEKETAQQHENRAAPL
ncbi:MFS transporter [Paenibacillus filicis]|uniref:MFS transporter n=1 Tax=Paenibacillus filicis TaxID=669464 RepID=A0ABU9DE91_9BACL